MSAKMSVVYVPDTGHAVGAVSRTADPTVPFDITKLGGGYMIVKNQNSPIVPPPPGMQGEEFFVPSSVLKVTTQPIDVDEGLLAMPLNYAVDKDMAHELGKPLPSAYSATLSSSVITLKDSGTNTLSTASDLTIWAQVQEQPPLAGNSPEIRISTGKMLKNHSKADIQLTGSPGGTPISLPAGRTYSVLLLVADYEPYFKTLLLT